MRLTRREYFNPKDRYCLEILHLQITKINYIEVYGFERSGSFKYYSIENNIEKVIEIMSNKPLPDPYSDRLLKYMMFPSRFINHYRKPKESGVSIKKSVFFVPSKPKNKIHSLQEIQVLRNKAKLLIQNRQNARVIPFKDWFFLIFVLLHQSKVY